MPHSMNTPERPARDGQFSESDWVGGSEGGLFVRPTGGATRIQGNRPGRAGEDSGFAVFILERGDFRERGRVGGPVGEFGVEQQCAYFASPG